MKTTIEVFCRNCEDLIYGSETDLCVAYGQTPFIDNMVVSSTSMFQENLTQRWAELGWHRLGAE